jgi:hypothetical protein
MLYVTDCIFPPRDSIHKGHKLKKNQYRNRLLAFADIERESDTNIDLIIASTEKLNTQIEKLNILTNKGVHSDLYRYEVRRILIRTIILLDDIISLKSDNFTIKTRFNTDDFLNKLKE